MINVDELKQLVEWIANKHQSGGNMSPVEYNIAIQSCLDDMLLYYYGLPQRYAPGAPVPSVAWEVTQLVTDYLRALKESPILPVDATGKMTIPSDYLHKSSVFYDYTTQDDHCADQDELVKCADDEVTIQGTTVAAQSVHVAKVIHVPVKIVTDDQWASLQSHSLKYPTLRYPIAKFMNTYLQLAPSNLGFVTFVYIRYPLTPVWAYTNPSGSNPVYNPVLSVDLEIPSVMKNHVAYCILTKLGVNIREAQLYQYAESFKEKGI